LGRPKHTSWVRDATSVPCETHRSSPRRHTVALKSRRYPPPNLGCRLGGLAIHAFAWARAAPAGRRRHLGAQQARDLRQPASTRPPITGPFVRGTGGGGLWQRIATPLWRTFRLLHAGDMANELQSHSRRQAAPWQRHAGPGHTADPRPPARAWVEAGRSAQQRKPAARPSKGHGPVQAGEGKDRIEGTYSGHVQDKLCFGNPRPISPPVDRQRSKGNMYAPLAGGLHVCNHPSRILRPAKSTGPSNTAAL
jgi:hypothetical protein